MGAACCAGAAVAGGAASSGPSSLLDGTIWGFLSAIPVALYHFYPQITIALSTLLVVGATSLYFLLIYLTPETKASSASELTYLSTRSNKPEALPFLAPRDDEAEKQKQSQEQEQQVQLSIVIPAYNEKERLPIMLDETIEYLETLRKKKKPLISGPLGNTHSNGGSAAANGLADPSRVAKSGPAQSILSALSQPLSTYEILIVDDGSKDNTHQVALDQSRKHPGVEVRVVRLIKNRGKGGAVRHGVLHSRGQLILFADADGATRFSDLGKLCSQMYKMVTDGGHGVVVGSRAHMVKSDAVVKRSFIRNFLMHSFHLFLSLLLRPPTLSGVLRKVLGDRSKKSSITKQSKAGEKRRSLPTQPEIQDTQCGFKLFTRPTAKLIFPASHIDGWIFDVELLILAQMSSKLAMQTNPPSTPQFGTCSKMDSSSNSGSSITKTDASDSSDRLAGLPLPIAEVAVDWKEVGGSKIDLLRDSIRMALDLIVIRFNYGTGRWTQPEPAL